MKQSRSSGLSNLNHNFDAAAAKRIKGAAAHCCVPVADFIRVVCMDAANQVKHSGRIIFGAWRRTAAGLRPAGVTAPVITGFLSGEAAAKLFSNKGAAAAAEFAPFDTPYFRENAWLSYLDEARRFGYEPYFVKLEKVRAPKLDNQSEQPKAV